MEGNSKVIMGATVVTVVTVAIVLGLVLVLLAELYCSFLLRRRHHHQKPASSTTTTATAEEPHQPNDVAPSLCSFYAQGVLRAPRSFLFPAPENCQHDLEKQVQHYPVSRDTPSSSNYPWQLVQETSPPPARTSTSTMINEQLIYICNPIYDGAAAVNRINSKNNMDTPFETPESSPSHLETESNTSPSTPPLTPMKKLLPTEGFSISLRDARSICTTPSDSNTNNYANSSSSSASPSTSPSW